MPPSARIDLPTPQMAPLAPAPALAARPVVGAVHLRRVALFLAALLLVCLGTIVSDRNARPNGPAAWRADLRHAASEAHAGAVR